MRSGSLAGLLVVGACFNPRYQNPTCGPNGECPPGWSCVAGTCRAESPDDAPTTGEDSSADASRDDAPTSDVPPDTLMTVSFQQGTGGYMQCHDTYLDGGTPTTTRGSDNSVRWRFELDKERTGLLRFGNIFGAGAIPGTATIISATLTVQIEQTNSAGTLAEVAIAWDASTITFDTFGADPGIDAGDIGMMLGATPTTQGSHDIDVTATVERWRTNQIENNGWAFIPNNSGGTGDAAFRSSEYLLAGMRPTLTVTYSP